MASRLAILFRISIVFIAIAMPCIAFAQGYSPDEAPQHMTVADGFTVSLVAAEPVVRQPVAIEFDDRGRLWAVQYLQYPNPAGLQRVKVDRYSRTIYDRVPEPPPRGPRGADRISLLTDIDEQGRARQAHDFVGQLNLASGIAFGHGGVFVLQVPYLLFYPDHDRDDVPDGDPEVLLTGFGMEDAHSVANSLTWGPDGWLYGCQGSTVTANIRGIEFQQGVWRYHPLTKKFELFCEGGGNSWGLDFDRFGNLVYSTNFGGYVMLHGVQGAYYWKQFGKHGALHNPFAYGYFDHVPHQNFRGGHVTVGGLIYQGDSFPATFRGRYITGDLLGHGVYWHEIMADGSSFRTVHGGELLLANDTWFATSDVTMSPDGSIYVADWNDKRMAHPDPDAEWDRSNGRIYRIAARNARPLASFDLAQLPSAELIKLLSNSNDWFRRHARQELARRRDPSVIAPLERLVFESQDEELPLQALWALYVSGGFTDELATKLLDHPHPHIRRWTVRFLGDERSVSPHLSQQLTALAAREQNAFVRSQLACTARRLRAADGLPIVGQLLESDQDATDPQIPLLVWWAIEEHAIDAMDRILTLLDTPDRWQRTIVRETILPRLIRRYAAAGTDASYTACARLLNDAPSALDRSQLLLSFEQGLQEQTPLQGTPLGTLFSEQAARDPASPPAVAKKLELPPSLQTELDALWRSEPDNVTLLRIALRLGRESALQRAIKLATDNQQPETTRAVMLQALAEFGTPSCVAPLVDLLGGAQPEAIQLAALSALQRFDDDAIPSALLSKFSQFTPASRTRATEVLLSRKPWCQTFLAEVDQGHIPATDINVDALRVVALHGDPSLDQLVRKLWGNVQAGTPEEKLAEMRRLSNDLRANPGNPRAGQAVFREHCANCHRLFGEGQTVGPDLTHANRKDRDYLLASIVDPSVVIRKEFLSYSLETTDGRILTGLIVDQSPNSVTLLDAKNQRMTVPSADIEALHESATSLMPENLLKPLKPQEVADLFGYLEEAAER